MAGLKYPYKDMRRFILSRFVLLLLVVLQTASLSTAKAAPAPVTTSPQIFPLHFVSFLKAGPVISRIAMKANFKAYSNLPSYKQFIDAPEDSPERAVAHYIQTLSDNGTTVSPETMNAAKSFYADGEKEGNEKAVAEQIQSDYKLIRKVTTSDSDIKLWHRYDVGTLSVISFASISPRRIQPYHAVYLRKSGSSYFITTYPRRDRDEDRTDLIPQLITLNESNLVARPDLADVLQPIYPYHFSLHAPFPNDTSVAPPLEVLFDGKVSNTLIDEKTITTDSVQAFVKHAIQTFRYGTLQEFLALYTDYDKTHILFPELQMQTGVNSSRIPPYELVKNWKQIEVHSVFTIDCDVESLVFLRTSDSEELKFMNVWKQAPNDYRLSQSGSLESGDTLPGNLKPLLNSTEFQTYLNAQIDEFIKQDN